jgi:hypothetical protein
VGVGATNHATETANECNEGDGARNQCPCSQIVVNEEKKKKRKKRNCVADAPNTTVVPETRHCFHCQCSQSSLPFKIKKGRNELLLQLKKKTHKTACEHCYLWTKPPPGSAGFLRIAPHTVGVFGAVRASGIFGTGRGFCRSGARRTSGRGVRGNGGGGVGGGDALTQEEKEEEQRKDAVHSVGRGKKKGNRCVFWVEFCVGLVQKEAGKTREKEKSFFFSKLKEGRKRKKRKK